MAGVEGRLIVKWDGPAISRLKGKTREGAQNAAITTAHRVQQNIRAAGRVDTGRMLNSIDIRKDRSTENSDWWTVGSNLDYTMYQEKGIGPVHARPGGILAFKPKGSYAMIFRPRTRGFSGANFLRNAASSIRFRDFVT